MKRIETFIVVLLILVVSAIFSSCNSLIYIIGDGPDTPKIPKEERDFQIRRERYVASHPELTERQKALILAGRVGEGLTKEEIIDILDWPKPDIVQPTTKYGADEIWIYKSFRPSGDRKLYFKNNILIKIE